MLDGLSEVARGPWRLDEVTRRVDYLAGRLRRVFRHRWDLLAVIAVGGAVGSLGRWGLTQLLPHPVGTIPWATFMANVTGCLLLGLLMVFVIEVRPPSRYLRPFLGIGVLGGYTTFSAYMLDARALLVAGRTAVAGGYVFGSLLSGLAAVWVGVSVARLFVRYRSAPDDLHRGERPGTSPAALHRDRAPGTRPRPGRCEVVVLIVDTPEKIRARSSSPRERRWPR